MKLYAHFSRFFEENFDEIESRIFVTGDLFLLVATSVKYEVANFAQMKNKQRLQTLEKLLKYYFTMSKLSPFTLSKRFF